MLPCNRQNILSCKASLGFRKISDGQHDSRISCMVPSMHPERNSVNLHLMTAKSSSAIGLASLDILKVNCTFQCSRIKCLIADGSPGELYDADEDLCPVECVREFKTDKEFLRILEKAKEAHSLVVVDFYRTSCGSCKYIEQGFAKLCRGSGDKGAPVIFLKHNVIDEYDEESEVADRLRIRAVPLFHFYKDGVLVESFATRDKERIDAAILKYTSPSSENS